MKFVVKEQKTYFYEKDVTVKLHPDTKKTIKKTLLYSVGVIGAASLTYLVFTTPDTKKKN